MSSAGILQDPVALADAAGDKWPARFRPTLGKLVAELRHRSGSAPVAIEPLRELRRPFSTLLHVRISVGSDRRAAFIKILQPRTHTPEELAATRRNVKREFDVTSRVGDALAGCSGLAAVRPIACFPEECALITEEVEGATLSRLLAREGAGWPGKPTVDRLSYTCTMAGAWLRAAQSRLTPDREVTTETIARYLDRRINELAASPRGTITAIGRSRLERCRDRLLDAAARDGVHAVWIHADFCPDNIIVSGTTVTVLDFTMAGAGTRYHDVAHLFLSVDAVRGRPWYKSEHVDRWQRALLDGFEPGLDVTNPVFMLARFQHTLCHLVAQQGVEGRVTRLYSGWRGRSYRRWLSEVAGLDSESWTR